MDILVIIKNEKNRQYFARNLGFTFITFIVMIKLVDYLLET